MFSAHLFLTLGIALPALAWTQGPECSSPNYIWTVSSTIQNPPATPSPPSYTPTNFCSSLLQSTVYHEIPVTSTGTSTATTTSTIPHTTTIVDSSSPTSYIYCPLPSANPVCGLKFNNVIAPQVMNQIYNPESGSTAYAYVTESECHELCVARSDCHSFLLEGTDPPGSPKACSLFGENLGVNGTRAESTPEFVDQWPAWYDRNCQNWLPDSCTPSPLTAMLKRKREAPAEPAKPTITASPVALEKREIKDVPEYLTQYSWANYIYLSLGCSCVITSASPVTDVTTTSTYTKYIDTVTTTVTTDSTLYILTTPHVATATTSIL